MCLEAGRLEIWQSKMKIKERQYQLNSVNNSTFRPTTFGLQILLFIYKLNVKIET